MKADGEQTNPSILLESRVQIDVGGIFCECLLLMVFILFLTSFTYLFHFEHILHIYYHAVSF